MQRRLNGARADVAEAQASYRIAAFTAYQKPERAGREISAYYERHGREALLNELRENPEQFGLRRGHVVSRDGWREGAPEREKHAREALLSLADKAEAVVLSNQRLEAVKESVDPQLAMHLARNRDRGGPER